MANHTDSLSGVRAKIERANQHVNDLQAAVNTFAERKSNRVIIEVDKEARKTIFKAQITEDIPPEVSAIIGDCVHNLRTALDYIICNAVVTNKRQIRKAHGFPIASSRKKFEAACVGKIDGTTQEVAKLLHRLKPYSGGREPFWIIHELDRLDKHQAIIPIWSAYRSMVISPAANFFGLKPGEERPALTLSPKDRVFPVYDGTELMTFSGDTSAFGLLKQYTDVNFAFEIAFGESQVVQGEPVGPTLKQLIRFTSRVADIFDRYIFK